MDAVTIAQALHWFAGEAFYAEVRRVARPGALVAAWTYGLARIDPAVDAVLDAFHDHAMAPWWPERRRHVVNGYRDLPFPFAPVAVPAFTMTADWDMESALRYLSTWSAVARARRETGADPVAALRAELRPAWGDPRRRRRVTWPLSVRAGTVG